MSASDPAIIGVQKCGCVTLAIARPSEVLHREDQKAISEVIQSGGSVLHTTVGGARRRKHFLVDECPHEPKGWTHQ